MGGGRGELYNQQVVNVFFVNICTSLLWADCCYSETCLKRPPMGQYELAIIDRWSLGTISCVMQPLHNSVALESD